jgi:hypothetical protein
MNELRNEFRMTEQVMPIARGGEAALTKAIDEQKKIEVLLDCKRR